MSCRLWVFFFSCRRESKQTRWLQTFGVSENKHFFLELVRALVLARVNKLVLYLELKVCLEFTFDATTMNCLLPSCMRDSCRFNGLQTRPHSTYTSSFLLGQSMAL